MFVHRYVKELTFDQNFADEIDNWLNEQLAENSMVRNQAEEPIAEPVVELVVQSIVQPEVRPTTQPEVISRSDSFLQNNQTTSSSQPDIQQTSSSEPAAALSSSASQPEMQVIRNQPTEMRSLPEVPRPSSSRPETAPLLPPTQPEMNVLRDSRPEVTLNNRKSERTPLKTLNRTTKRSSPKRLKHREHMNKRTAKIANYFQKLKNLLGIDENASQQHTLKYALLKIETLIRDNSNSKALSERTQSHNTTLLSANSLLKERVRHLEQELAKFSN